LLAFSDSEHTTKDNDFHVDEEHGVAGFEIKRKIDEAACNIPARRTTTG
jgi:hypothetical protein